MASSAAPRATLHYDVPASRDDWTLTEESVPESQPHDIVIDLMKAILLAWAARTRRSVQVARNLAIRWDAARPQIGVDPDLCILEPRTPEGDQLESLCTWREGHAPPRVALEVVSSRAHKDYVVAPEKYAACGAAEVWIFDPKLSGPRAFGGPFRLQVWCRDRDGALARSYAGPGPAFSPTLGAYLIAVDEGQKLRVAEDEAGERWWPTAEEAERAAKDTERAAKDEERAAKETALARVAALEAELARRDG